MDALEILANVKPSDATQDQFWTIVLALRDNREGVKPLTRDQVFDLQQFEIIAASWQTAPTRKTDSYAQECRDEGVSM